MPAHTCGYPLTALVHTPFSDSACYMYLTTLQYSGDWETRASRVHPDGVPAHTRSTPPRSCNMDPAPRNTQRSPPHPLMTPYPPPCVHVPRIFRFWPRGERCARCLTADRRPPMRRRFRPFVHTWPMRIFPRYEESHTDPGTRKYMKTMAEEAGRGARSAPPTTPTCGKWIHSRPWSCRETPSRATLIFGVPPIGPATHTCYIPS